MTDESNNPTRNLILQAVIRCIEKYDIASLTTRKIAEEAGTNIASINYHFRTKAQLVDEALSLTTRNSLEDLTTLIKQTEHSLAEILEDVCFYLIEGGLRYPGITLAHLYTIMLEKRYDTAAADMFSQMFIQLVERACVEFPNAKQNHIKTALTHVLSAAIFSVLAPGIFLPHTTLDLSQPHGDRKLAHSLTLLFINSLEK
jgi:AcrR family transcriptional regulator